MASSARTPSRWPSGSFAAYDWTAPADTKRPSDDERVERTCRPINEMESARTPGGLRECRGTARYKTGRPPAAVDRMRQPQARDARRDGGRRDPIPNTPQCLPRIELGLRRQMECQVCAGYLSDEQQAVLLAREEELQDRRADVRPRERDQELSAHRGEPTNLRRPLPALPQSPRCLRRARQILRSLARHEGPARHQAHPAGLTGVREVDEASARGGKTASSAESVG